MQTQYPSQATSTARAGQSMKMRRHIGAVILALLALLPAVPLLAQGTVLIPPKFTAQDNNGLPCNGCLLYTYSAGTTTPLATYSESTLTTPNANPVVMDSAGRATIFLSASSYKFILKTSAGTTLWTVDNVASIGLSTAAIGESLVVFAGDPNSPITATSYSSGATYDKAHAGTVFFSFDSANRVGTYALEGMLIGSGGTVSAALVNLSDGSPDTGLVTITSTSAVGERVQSSAITFAGSGANKVYAIKMKVSAGFGYGWGFRLVRIG